MYSVISPAISSVINRILDLIKYILNFLYRKAKGIKRVISTSKIRNTRPTRKNCVLMGIRLLDRGSNPHSNGDFFSREWSCFLDIRLLISMMRVGIKTLMIDRVSILIIIYISLSKFLNWKLIVIKLYYINKFLVPSSVYRDE